MENEILNTQSGRLAYIQKITGYSQVDIERKTAITQPYLSAILRGKTGIGAKIGAKIAALHPSISLDWLLQGKGEPPTTEVTHTGNLEVVQKYKEKEPVPINIITTPKGKTISIYETDAGISILIN